MDGWSGACQLALWCGVVPAGLGVMLGCLQVQLDEDLRAVA